MRQTPAEVTAVEAIGRFVRVRLSAPELAPALKPGRAVLVGPIGGYLRRTWWPCAIDHAGFAVLLDRQSDPGLRPGDTLDVIGAIGRGFEVDDASRHLLLVAAESSAPVPSLGPLLALLDWASAAGRSVTLTYAAPSADEAYPVSALPPAIEVIRARDADLIDLLPDAIGWADQLFACGPPVFTARLAERIADVRYSAPRDFAQALHPVDLVCGVGACGACWQTSKRMCVDGPVLELNTRAVRLRRM